jgi:hypothetical protein
LDAGSLRVTQFFLLEISANRKSLNPLWELAERVGLPPAKRGALRDLDDESLQATSAFKPMA